MKTVFAVLMMVFLLVLVPGCGSGDKEKGMNSPERRHDLPRAAPTEEGK
jgi:hypothetical protein